MSSKFAFTAIIPARHASTRLPGKPLATIGGQPMIQRVWARTCASGARAVIVATDDARIFDACRAFGAECEMTSTRHSSGTDRIAEVVARRNLDPEMIIVNVQGDEPLIPSILVHDVAGCLHSNPSADIATAVAPIASAKEFLDANCVKALRAVDGRALYFTRAPAPWPREHAPDGVAQDFSQAWRHIGIYAYRVRSLMKFAALAVTPLEQCESLEQLRALEHGMRIQLLALDHAPAAGVDTPEDLEAARALFPGSTGFSPNQ